MSRIKNFKLVLLLFLFLGVFILLFSGISVNAMNADDEIIHTETNNSERKTVNVSTEADFKAAIRGLEVRKIIVDEEINILIEGPRDVMSIRNDMVIQGNGNLNIKLVNNTGEPAIITVINNDLSKPITVDISGLTYTGLGRQNINDGVYTNALIRVINNKYLGDIDLNLSSSTIEDAYIVNTFGIKGSNDFNFRNNELINSTTFSNQDTHFNTEVTKSIIESDLELEGNVKVFNRDETVGNNLNDLKGSKVEFVVFEEGQPFSTTGGIRVDVSSQISTANVTEGVATFTGTIPKTDVQKSKKYSAYLVITDNDKSYIKSEDFKVINQVDVLVGSVESNRVNLNVVDNLVGSTVRIELLDSRGNSFNPVVKKSKTGSGQVEFDNLEPNTTYKYKVTDTKNNVIKTSVDRFTTMQVEASVDVVVDNVELRRAILNVVNNGIENTIEIELLDSEGNSFNPVVKKSKVGNGQVEFNNLEPNTTYKYKVTDTEGNVITTTVDRFITTQVDVVVDNIESRRAILNVVNNGIENTIKIELLNAEGNSFNPVVKKSKVGNGQVEFDNLEPNTTYKYKVTDTEANVITTSMDRFTTRSVIISGNDNGSSDTGITSSDIRKSKIGDTYAEFYLNPSNLRLLKNAKDITFNIDGLKVDGVVEDKLLTKGYVPGKKYTDLVIEYTDDNRKDKEIKVSGFTTKKETTKLNNFIIDVYKESLSRQADEVGFNFWVKKLSSSEISPAEFVLNLLNEPEFLEKHKESNEIIDALYNVIVNRSSDVQGAKFWINKFDSYISSGLGKKLSLNSVANEMVNEKEFLDRVNSLDL